MNISDFEQKLTATQSEFEALGPLGSGYLHLRFNGPFEDQTIIWDAHLYTLAYFNHEIMKLGPGPHHCRQFIHVSEQIENSRKIEIGLHLPFIDTPAVKKTIIMVRQYKNLVIGRYEYGETISV